jgi:hypothetical protein
MGIQAATAAGMASVKVVPERKSFIPNWPATATSKSDA